MKGDRKNVYIIMCTLVCTSYEQCKCLQSANATANSRPIQCSPFSLTMNCPIHQHCLDSLCVCVCVCVGIYLEFVGCPLMENKTIVQQPVDLLTLNYHMTNAGTNFIRRSVCKCMRATMHCMKE